MMKYYHYQNREKELQVELLVEEEERPLGQGVMELPPEEVVIPLSLVTVEPLPELERPLAPETVKPLVLEALEPRLLEKHQPPLNQAQPHLKSRAPLHQIQSKSLQLHKQFCSLRQHQRSRAQV